MRQEVHSSLSRDAAAAQREKDQRARIIETAALLYREIGFQKTTVADIARELRMSSANVYRFFSSKAEINEAVSRHLLGEVEAAAEKIVVGPGDAKARLATLVSTIEAMNGERMLCERKLQEMVAVALREDWPVINEHVFRMRALMARLIESGVKSGEFQACDPELTAGLLQTALIRYHHPGLMVECADKETPESSHMMAFCLRALEAR